MLLFNGDVEITTESLDWIVYGVKAMDFFYFIKIPRWLKEKAESSKAELEEELMSHNIDFKNLVIEIIKNKDRNYKAEIETKAYETTPKEPKAEQGEEGQPTLF